MRIKEKLNTIQLELHYEIGNMILRFLQKHFEDVIQERDEDVIFSYVVDEWAQHGDY